MLADVDAELDTPGILGIGRFGGGPAGRVWAADERRRWEIGEEFGWKEVGPEEGPG